MIGVLGVFVDRRSGMVKMLGYLVDQLWSL